MSRFKTTLIVVLVFAAILAYVLLVEGKKELPAPPDVTLSPTPRLEGRYTAFGRVTAGLAVLEQIQIGDWFRVEIMPPDSEAPGSEGASERESDAR